MGSHQVFCLRWSNHQSNMLSVFDELLQTEALVDVTIACEGLSLKAHKVVLSACSPYFQALFVQNPCKHPIVILKDIKYTELKSLVDFMYKGEVNVTKEQLSALLKTAETLKIKGLAEVTGGVNGQHEPAESLSRLSFPNAAERGLPLLGNSSGGSQQGLLVSEESGSRSPPPLPLHTIPYHKSVNVSGVGGGGSSSSTGRSIRSPLPKRKKTRHRKRSSDGASAPDESENVSSVEVRGSPEMIVAKVEVSDDYDNVPPGMGDTDEGGKLSVDQGEDSNDESMDNLYTSQGPASNPADEEYSAMDDPMSSSSQTPLSLIQKLKTSGPSTSLSGSNQGGDHESTAHLEFGGGDVGGDPYAAAGTPSGTGYIPKRGQPRILNVDEEAMIVKYIMDMAAQGRPATRRCVLEYGNTLLRREDRVPTGSIHCNPEKGLSNDWWKEFKKRHPGLPVRIPASSTQQSQDVP